jgi:hypothetical protein
MPRYSDCVPSACRSLNVEHFNRIVNHETVRSQLGGDGTLDLTSIIDDVNNFAFETEHGGFILWNLGSGRYDVHSLFLPEGRGVEAMRAMISVAAYMFTRTDCTEGRTTVPASNPGAMVLAKRGGFECRFELDRLPWKLGETVKASFLALTLEKWALTAPEPIHAGRWFHDQLEAAKQAAGSTSPVHVDEAVHDRIAGAALLMVRGGQPEKAVAFYNAWAMTTRYATIGLRSKRPIVLDIGDALIEANGDAMEILTCR